MKTEVCTYQGNAGTFVAGRDSMMVNATDMARAFGKQVNDFTSADHTKTFIRSCIKNCKSRFLSIEKEDDPIISRQKSDTWIHRVLALKFAAWLNPDFEVLVYGTIENLLFGRLVKLEQFFECTSSLQRKKKELQCKPGKTGEDFERYLQILKALNDETSLRKSLSLESISEANGIP